jgi:hypothetical protein
MNEETRVLIDYAGRDIRLTSERWQHILDHPEMGDQEERLAETLREPDTVIATQRDPTVQCYHRLYEDTPVTRKYLMIAVKVLDDDAFVITAHFMSRLKRGTKIWPK